MSAAVPYARLASLKSAASFRRYLATLGLPLDFDEVVETGVDAPLARPLVCEGRTIGNRFSVLPMEGWDGTTAGEPSELTFRRWRRFGQSGAKLIWGGEAVAVRHDGRANPNQLVLTDGTQASIAALRIALVEEHQRSFGRTDDLLVGLQVTHSGRFSRPNQKTRLEPVILYHHPLLDVRFGIGSEHRCLTDSEIARLIDDFVAAAVRAADMGFDFVDIKHCHGYLGHEFLSAVDRPSPYGGSFENRTRFLREVVAGIRARAPRLGIGVRVSVFDDVPFRRAEDGAGVPASYVGEYPYAFGVDASAPIAVGRANVKLNEAFAFLDLLLSLDVRLVCVSAGSPYYSPHIQRPALFPPSDGYDPPEDPLVGVARQISATAALKAYAPDLIVVGSGYSYLQEWLPHVAQYNVRNAKVDFVGLGRIMLPYPEFARDVLEGRPLRTKMLCRTFSDCTTGPRNGLVSGCYPLDPFYKSHPDGEVLRRVKRQPKSE
ncbi:MAG TPA: NADH:flavin oxidoreductase [Terriglobia bacterium]|nr:NADH:flavin oxidoreductase [Terriglobia bacterium]